jgi:hypothetical protein
MDACCVDWPCHFRCDVVFVFGIGIGIGITISFATHTHTPYWKLESEACSSTRH